MKRVLLFVMLALLLVSGLVVAQEKTQITFWHAMGGWRIELIEEMCTEFNRQNPGIEVTPEFKGGYTTTFTAAIAAAQAGAAPQVLHVVETAIREAIDSGLFASAEELIERFGMEVTWDDYIAPVLNTYRVEGQLHFFPWNSSSGILFYNKDILDAAGVSLPKKPTYEDIIEVGRAVVNGGFATYAITWPLTYWFEEMFIAEQGQVLVDNENGRAGRPTKAYLTSDAAIRVYDWWKQLYDEGLWVNPGRSAWGEALRIFSSNESAMFISTTGHVTSVEDRSAEGGYEVGTTFLPIPAGTERHGVTLGGGALALLGDHPDEVLEAATKFVLWMSDTPQTIKWHKGTGYYPITNAAVEALEEEGWFDLHPNFRTAFDQVLETQQIPATQGAMFGAFRQVSELMAIAFEEIMTGKSVIEALELANAEANAAIAEYRLLMGEPIEEE